MNCPRLRTGAFAEPSSACSNKLAKRGSIRGERKRRNTIAPAQVTRPHCPDTSLQPDMPFLRQRTIFDKALGQYTRESEERVWLPARGSPNSQPQRHGCVARRLTANSTDSCTLAKGIKHTVQPFCSRTGSSFVSFRGYIGSTPSPGTPDDRRCSALRRG
jgi:hypothetical protein